MYPLFMVGFIDCTWVYTAMTQAGHLSGQDSRPYDHVTGRARITDHATRAMGLSQVLPTQLSRRKGELEYVQARGRRLKHIYVIKPHTDSRASWLVNMSVYCTWCVAHKPDSMGRDSRSGSPWDLSLCLFLSLVPICILYNKAVPASHSDTLLNRKRL